MKNLFLRTYQELDNGLIDLANKSIEMYNWTTGKTKANLANKLQMIAPVFETISFLPALPDYSLVSMATFASILSSYFVQKWNSKLEDRELSALESRMQDPHVYYMMKYYERLGIILGSFSLYAFIMDYFKPGESLNIFAIGMAARAASYYIMRSDNLPPRKGMVKRTLEKLDDIVKSYSSSPVPTLN